MRIRAISISCIYLIATFSLEAATPQSQSADNTNFHSTPIQGHAPAASAHILRYNLDKPKPGSGNEKGNLHIIYSDGTEVVGILAPKPKGTVAEGEYTQVGINSIKVAPDHQTIGWAEMVENCCTSYSIPVSLAIYSAGGEVLHIKQGQMLWYWNFRDNGKHVVTVWGATHGPQIGTYQLIDLSTKRLLDEVYGDEDTQSLKPSAPQWAKQTEMEMTR